VNAVNGTRAIIRYWYLMSIIKNPGYLFYRSDAHGGYERQRFFRYLPATGNHDYFCGGVEYLGDIELQ